MTKRLTEDWTKVEDTLTYDVSYGNCKLNNVQNKLKLIVMLSYKLQK